MTTYCKMIFFHRNKGEYANASLWMRIKLFQSVTECGRTYYFWELSNIYTGHRWFTEIRESTYSRLWLRLASSYRFISRPGYKASAHSATVYETEFYL